MGPNYELINAEHALRWSVEGGTWSPTLTIAQCKALLDELAELRKPWEPRPLPTSADQLTLGTASYPWPRPVVIDSAAVDRAIASGEAYYFGDPGDESDHDER